MRLARPDDSLLAWLWRNDPETRAASRNSDPIAWPDHDRWWKETLASPDRHLFIADGAVVRFDRLEDGSFEVSINLSPALRGQGRGGPILAEACRSFGERLVATIHCDNARSRRIFEKVGFVCSGSGSPFERYELA